MAAATPSRLLFRLMKSLDRKNLIPESELPSLSSLREAALDGATVIGDCAFLSAHGATCEFAYKTACA
ncbi:MAG: hypothetical protein DWQ08_06060, partial [Proteobacteria bacterium]